MVVNDDWERFLSKQRAAHPLYLEGVAAERERIIALLEALDAEEWCGTNLQIVDLIKGEN